VIQTCNLPFIPSRSEHDNLELNPHCTAIVPVAEVDEAKGYGIESGFIPSPVLPPPCIAQCEGYRTM
jgi:hypothetical protein